jgi:hypothetical protein
MASVLKELAVRKKMTITMDEAFYEGLVRVVSRRKISSFIVEHVLKIQLGLPL